MLLLRAVWLVHRLCGVQDKNLPTTVICRFSDS
ncbi:hypothetical protein GECvBGOT_gp074 [Salmonella phage GEC_vB_GOT]|nr:hypothetical protein GECvBGOT_gp074 [Salmonella phage GEC_vB_GOT]